MKQLLNGNYAPTPLQPWTVVAGMGIPSSLVCHFNRLESQKLKVMLHIECDTCSRDNWLRCRFTIGSRHSWGCLETLCVMKLAEFTQQWHLTGSIYSLSGVFIRNNIKAPLSTFDESHFLSSENLTKHTFQKTNWSANLLFQAFRKREKKKSHTLTLSHSPFLSILFLSFYAET